MRHISKFRKTDLMDLPEGGWILSNTGKFDDMYFHPRVEVQLPPVSDTEAREHIWTGVRDFVSGRMVHYCENDEDYWRNRCIKGVAE